MTRSAKLYPDLGGSPNLFHEYILSVDKSTAMADQPDVYIKAVTAQDSPALSRICLLTGDAGASAEHLHNFGELPGLVYAEPYAQLPAGFGFVMVDPTKSDAVVGYVLGTFDTRAFEQQADTSWYPPLRERYPQHNPPESTAATSPPPKPADARYIRTLHNPQRALDVCIAFSPAHLHIDILPEYQRQGWGRRLMARAIEFLQQENGIDRVWLGLDLRNAGARRFYERLGFQPLDGAPEGTMGLRFEDFWR